MGGLFWDLFPAEDFPDFVKSTGREKDYKGKGVYFLFSLSIASDLRSVLDEIVSPHSMRIIVPKFNTDSLGSCFFLPPDSENHCRFTVNSERTGAPDSHSQCLQNGNLKHFTTSKDCWGKVLAPACLACNPRDKKHFSLYPIWLSLLEAVHVRETGNLGSTFKAMW